jgi:5-aminolevulinate synthase
LLFTSGYVSNEATLSTLAKLLPGCIVFSDALNHASMIAGIKNSGCEKQVFRHNDLAHLEELLAAAPEDAPKLIAFESVYSMDGDVAPIAAICDLAEKFGALTYLDEVHAVGHVRRARRRHFRARRLAHRIDIIEGHAGQGDRRDGRLYRGPPQHHRRDPLLRAGFIFTTRCRRCWSPARWRACAPQAIVGRARGPAGVRRQAEGDLRRRGLPVLPSETHIVPLMVGDPVKAKADQRHPARRIWRLRAADQLSRPCRAAPSACASRPGPAHTEAMMHELAGALVEIWDRLELRQAA